LKDNNKNMENITKLDPKLENEKLDTIANLLEKLAGETAYIIYITDTDLNYLLSIAKSKKKHSETVRKKYCEEKNIEYKPNNNNKILKSLCILKQFTK
jgi:hypothetical protein